jgi:four helix bundle protein
MNLPPFNLAHIRQRLLHHILELTDQFPPEDPHGLAGRLRRAISSMPTQQRHAKANAEAARSSAAESRYLVSMSRRLGYASKEELEPVARDLSEIRRRLRPVR